MSFMERRTPHTHTPTHTIYLLVGKRFKEIGDCDLLVTNIK